MQIVEVQNKPVVNGWVRIVGSSNGLLCLRIHRYGNRTSTPSLLLWNLAFREVRKVPTSSPDLFGGCYIGFGFRPIVNDSKIVRLYCFNHDEKVHFAEVYSLSTGSWENIEIGNSGGLILMDDDDPGFTMNGAIFWLGLKKDMGESVEFAVVSFDIATQIFSLIPVSSTLNLVYRDSVGVHVTEFEHKLALFCSTPIGNYESCLIELWVLEKGMGGYGERLNWAKKYTCSPYQ